MITERPGQGESFGVAALHRALDTIDQLRPMPGVSKTTQGTHQFTDDAWPSEDIATIWKMFDLEIATATTIRVHAGEWARWVSPDDDYVIPLAVDSGTSNDPATKWKTLSSWTASTVHYVYVLLDDADLPTTLTAGASTTPIVDTTNVYRVLGTVTTDSSGNITAIQQWHTGRIRDGWFDASGTPDGLSINAATDGDLQWLGWETALAPMTSTVKSSDLLGIRLTGGEGVPTLFYDTIFESVKAAVNDPLFWGGVTKPLYSWQELTDTEGEITIDTVGQIAMVAAVEGPMHETVYRLKLLDPVDITGVFWVTGEPIYNPSGDSSLLSCFSSGIGDGSGALAIDLDNHWLTGKNLTGTYANWACKGDFTANMFKVAVGSPALTNEWNRAGLNVNTTGSVALTSDTDIVLSETTGDNGITINSGGIYFNPDASDGIFYSTLPGASVASWFKNGGFIHSTATAIDIYAPIELGGEIHCITVIGVDQGVAA